MLKNNHGVTLVALIATIIILFILLGVSLNTGFSTIDDIKLGKIISNMTLVRAKVENIAENYYFYNNDTDYLIGNETYKIDNTTYKLDNLTLSEEELDLIAQNAELEDKNEIYNWDWYKWDTNTLMSQGLDKTMLNKDEYFYINYENLEIIYTNGVEYDEEEYFYSMTGLDYIRKNK